MWGHVSSQDEFIISIRNIRKFPIKSEMQRKLIEVADADILRPVTPSPLATQKMKDVVRYILFI